MRVCFFAAALFLLLAHQHRAAAAAVNCSDAPSVRAAASANKQSACDLCHSSCSEVHSFCGLGDESQKLFNYFEFRWCGNWPPVLTTALMVCWLLVLLALLASTADNYLVPQLEVLSRCLRLSPSTAGITLLALGNSAPDVFDDLASVQATDMAMAVGELLGASIFVTTVVLAAVVLVAPSGDVFVDRRDFFRDVGVFSSALACLFVFSATDGSVTLLEAAVLVAIYAAYVAFVVLTTTSSCCAAERLHLEDGEGLDSVLLATSPAEEATPGHPADDHRIVGIDTDPDSGRFAKAVFFVEYPFSVLRWLTVGVTDFQWSHRRRFFAAVAPLGVLTVFFVDFSPTWTDGNSYDGFTDGPLFAILAAVATLLGVATWVRSSPTSPPPSAWHGFLLVLGFVSTVAWLDLVGHEVVAVLELLGASTGMTETKAGHSALGVTVLSWANCIGDFVADTAVCKAGRPKMAVSSVFGAPLLTACVGIGLSVVAGCVKFGKTRIQSQMNAELQVSYIFMAISLVSSLVVIPCSGYRLPRWYAFYLFAVYFLYMVFSTLVQLDVIF